MAIGPMPDNVPREEDEEDEEGEEGEEEGEQGPSPRSRQRQTESQEESQEKTERAKSRQMPRMPRMPRTVKPCCHVRCREYIDISRWEFELFDGLFLFPRMTTAVVDQILSTSSMMDESACQHDIFYMINNSRTGDPPRWLPWQRPAMEGLLWRMHQQMGIGASVETRGSSSRESPRMGLPR